MLEYRREDEARLIQNIVLGIGDSGVCWDCARLRLQTSCVLLPPPELKPKGVVVNMIPGLPAYILFMCIRHADYLKDEAKLTSLMNAVIDGVKKVISVSLELRLFWRRSPEN